MGFHFYFYQINSYRVRGLFFSPVNTITIIQLLMDCIFDKNKIRTYLLSTEVALLHANQRAPEKQRHIVSNAQ